MATARRAIVILMLTRVASGAVFYDQTGRLHTGLPVGPGGMYMVSEALRCAAGDVYVARVDSSEFDPVLVAVTPDGRRLGVAAVPGGGAAVLTLPCRSAGDLQLLVAALPGETGRYRLRIERRVLAAGPGALDKPIYQGKGALTDGDLKEHDEHPLDLYPIQAQADCIVVASARSVGFIPQVTLRTCASPQLMSIPDRMLSSEVAHITSQRETMPITVGSAEPGKSGDYTISVYLAALVPETGVLDEPGSVLSMLVGLDETDRVEGGFEATLTVPIIAGEVMSLELQPVGCRATITLTPPGRPAEAIEARADGVVERDVTGTEHGLLRLTLHQAGDRIEGHFRIVVKSVKPPPA